MHLNGKLIFAAFLQLLQQKSCDLSDLILLEHVEYDRLINSIQKLRPEDLFYLIHHAVLHELIILLCVF